MRRRWLAAAASSTPLLLRTPSSCVRFGDARSGVAICGSSAVAVYEACLARMKSTSLFALRRCREFGRLGEHTVGRCAIVEPASAVSPAGARLALPTFSPAGVYAPGVGARVLPCLPLPRRGRCASDGRKGVDGEHCAFAVLPSTACPACAVLGVALFCPGSLYACWNLKVTFTPWSSTE